MVTEEPVRMYRGVEESGEGAVELWHDYFSVPQWSDGLKGNILLVIHEIFHQADVTVVYLDDVLPRLFTQITGGRSPMERLTAITGVCKARWFKRMWTAMEFVRSRAVRIMTADYRLAVDTGDPMLLQTLETQFCREVQEHFRGNLYKVQHVVHMEAGNLIPWCLGPLRETRSSQPAIFGMAFSLLSKRLYREDTDFLYALRGITGIRQEPSTRDFYAELLWVAKERLLAGDYSPLLMTPKLEIYDRRLDPNEAYNFNDVWTWDFGDQVSLPIYGRPSLGSQENKLWGKFEAIGTVQMILEPVGFGDDVRHLKSSIDMTLTVTGPDLEPFVETLGSRIYGADKHVIMKHLKDNNLVESMKEALLAHHEGCRQWREWWVKSLKIGGDNIIRWFADALTLTNPIKSLGQTHMYAVGGKFGPMHCGPHMYFATICCGHCHKTALFRVGLFAPKYEARGARAWRIPGLQYSMSHRDGMAFLEKSGRIVGRMMWATPACDCRETEIVELQMPQIPDPRKYPKWEM
ncbi:hypothetical protein CkaCkLH20_08603 [Colletotrichum karsti]|uniref:Heterokaryon incompatibility domain-containing protein n=1 Tax=Colletotrichum karsti TaxID=1095194 RepID=A0A9P6LF79_9PEZI|nr:uncharacterized protein CkaCkLH20_08603 [Colletotrichum karsti]KAF9873869.1 hypothetical protein CkaCkLH20_08603 [Colletotrichum karsti]